MANGRFQIRSGARVIGVDGEIGRVEQLVITPSAGMVTGLLVRKGLLLCRDIVIPAEAVEDATQDLVRVRLSVRKLEQLPEYRDKDFARSRADWHSPAGVRAGEILFRLPGLFDRQRLQPARSGQAEAAVGGQPIRAGQPVVCRDGNVGPLALVLLDPASRRATHFVVRRGRLLGRDTIVPIE